MSLGMIIDILGIGVIFWSIGRTLQHVALKKTDSGTITPSSRIFYYLSILFYILGTFSSILIGLIDGMCHKRLYELHLSEMRQLKTYVTLPTLPKQPFDKFCEEHDIGKFSSSAPIDIPYTWYSIRR